MRIVYYPDPVLLKKAETLSKAPENLAEILEGIDHGVELLLPDEAARAAWLLKSQDRTAYDALMRAQAAKLEEAT